MPIDASIPLQGVPFKLPSALELMSLRDLSTRNQMNQVALEEKKQEQESKNMVLEMMKMPGAVDPATGRLSPQAIGEITRRNPKMGLELSNQDAQLSLRDMQFDEKRQAIKKNILIGYVTSYQNHLQSTGGNKQEAERLARQETMEVIKQGKSSGHFAAQGFNANELESALPPIDTARTVVTALGGDIKKSEPTPPKSAETRTLYFQGPGDVTYQKQQEWNQETRSFKDIPGTAVPRHRDVAPLDEKRVQQLGNALEKANISESITVLQEAENQIKTHPELSGYLTGLKSKIPDFAVPEEVRAGRQAFQKLFNITLKDRSGAAVTNPELERLKREFASGIFNTPEQIEEGLRQARNVIAKHYRTVAAGFGPQALKQFNENLQEIGGTPLDLEERPAKKKAQTGGPQEGQRSKSKSGRPIIYRNGRWEYE